MTPYLILVKNFINKDEFTLSSKLVHLTGESILLSKLKLNTWMSGNISEYTVWSKKTGPWSQIKENLNSSPLTY